MMLQAIEGTDILNNSIMASAISFNMLTRHGLSIDRARSMQYTARQLHYPSLSSTSFEDAVGQDPFLVALLQAHLFSVINRVPDYVASRAVGHEPIHCHQPMVTTRDLG